MRKFIIMILSVIALLCIHTTIYAEEVAVDTIKIGLFYGSTAQDTVTLESSQGFYAGTESEGQFIHTLTFPETLIPVSAGEGTTIAVGAYIYEAYEFPTLYPVSGTVIINGTEYRGGVQFKRINGGALTVINIVNIEEYLYSVIGREMNPSWNIEALKAQAVCARGFAISNKNKFASYGFNLDATTTSQVYSGVSAETESTRRAVDETRGQVLKHNGSIIESIYCASTGGATANAENVWGGAYPYLVSVNDPYENPAEATHYSWSVTLTSDEIEEHLANLGVYIGDITNIEIISQDAAGYVLELQFIGTQGTHTVTKSSCRTVFGGKLHSQRYNVTGGSYFFKVYNSSNEGQYIPNPGTSIIYALSYALDMALPPQNAPLATSAKFTFSGNGWGHGVGMSQWGAKAMADQGFAYSDILTFYYTGTYLENAY